MNRKFAASAGLLVVAVLMVNSLALPAYASKSRQLLISVEASSPVFAGQTVQISATVQFTNGTAVGNKASFSGSHIYYPNGTAVTLSASPTVTAPELVRWAYNVPSNAPNGLYSVTVRATVGPNATWGQASFTVNNLFASASALTAISSQLSSLNSQVVSLSSRLSSLSSDMEGNFTNMLNTLSGDFASLQGQVGSLSSSMAGNFTSLSGTLTTIKDTLGSLATSASVSDLKSTVQSGIGGINSTFGSLATSAQANAISSALHGLQNQTSNISNVENYVLLPAIIVAIALVLIVIFRRRS